MAERLEDIVAQIREFVEDQRIHGNDEYAEIAAAIMGRDPSQWAERNFYQILLALQAFPPTPTLEPLSQHSAWLRRFTSYVPAESLWWNALQRQVRLGSDPRGVYFPIHEAEQKIDPERPELRRYVQGANLGDSDDLEVASQVIDHLIGQLDEAERRLDMTLSRIG